jgi:hypothetical protein
VVLAGSAGLCLAGIAWADRTGRRSARLATGFGLALGTGFCFLYAFPELRSGPYGATDPILRKLLLDSASEATPLIKSQSLGMGAILWPLMAWMLSGFFLARDKIPWQRWIWGLFFLILGFCIPLSVFYQCRFQTYVETFSVIPLACAIQRNWEALKGFRSVADKMRVATLVVLIIAGPLALHLFIAPKADAAGIKGSGLSAQTNGTWGCDIHGLSAVLNDPRHYGDRPRLIMNSMNQGPELLFLTQHKVVAAPYFDREGNLDALQFFTTHDPAEAKSILRRRGADLVVLCGLPGQIVAYMPDEKTGADPNFAQRLLNGDAPKWLKRIPSPSFGDLMLFEVHL